MAKGTKVGSGTKPSSSSRALSGCSPRTAQDALGNAQRNEGRSISIALQQKLLNVFRDALEARPADTSILQEVKGHLYNRDFAAAFGKEDYLRVYALRWSASRAVGYLQIFSDIEDHALEASIAAPREEGNRFGVACLGGGAGAELVGLAGWVSLRHTEGYAADSGFRRELPLTVQLLDMADWKTLSDSLCQGCVTPPTLSKYASEAAKAANQALAFDGNFHTSFHRTDLLDVTDQQLTAIAQNDLVTLMFTLNELYSTNLPKTQTLLSRITQKMSPRSLLLVVDSPGSYSTVTINGAEKKYPMQWLLDHTLLGQPKGNRQPVNWEKLVSDDSRWFRLPQGLQYPVELENMRYQIHLYRRCNGSRSD